MALTHGDVLEVTVQAEAHGQKIDNQLHYYFDTALGPTMQEVLIEFRAMWRAEVLPLLHESYVVLQYIARPLLKVIWLGNNDTPPTDTRPAIRYKEQGFLQGVPATDKGGSVGAEHPTSTAVGFEKVCGTPQTFAVPPVPVLGEKLAKGAMRVGPIMEADTVVGDGNRLTAGANTLFQAMGTAIMELNVPAPVAIGAMCVVSFYKDKKHRSSGPVGNVPEFIVYPVTGMNLNELITTQTTRKQRAGGA